MAELAEVKQAFAELKTSVEELKRTNDQRIGLIEQRKEIPADLEEKLVKVQEAVAAADEKHQKLSDELKSVSEKLSALNALEEKMETSVDIVTHQKEFNTFLRKGDNNPEVKAKLEELQEKTLFASSDPDGGYAIPMPAVNKVVELIRETSPMRQVCSIETIGGEEFKYLIDIEDLDAGWVAERSSRPNTTTPRLQQGSIPAHELYANPRATQKMLDDQGFNVEQWLNRKVADKFARVENTAFLLGTGVGQPRGLLRYPGGTSWGQIERIRTGLAAAISADSLIVLQNSLKSEYAGNARFMMRRQTLASVRLLKDNEGQYLWQPGLREGQSPTLLGDPIVRASDMPAVAADALPIAYGDFRETYTIVDRIAIRVLRDPYTNKPYVEFYTTKRTGGDVTNFDSMKLLECKTA